MTFSAGSGTITPTFPAGLTQLHVLLTNSHYYRFESSGQVTTLQNGDVTGIQPISNRAVVYVCEDGILTIYDTALDLGNQRQLQPQKTQVTISGQVVDVKQVDF